MKNIEKKVDYVVNWLRSKVEEAGCKGLVVGLSGGIDSSVCAALMVKAMGDDALGVILPIKSSAADARDAVELAEAIGINYYTFDWSDVHNMMFDQIAETVTHDAKNARMTDANLRARLRMSSIYAIANLKNYLVVGTDNAAEIYTGYFTKYGDGGADILPLAHLSKAEVYAWGEYLNVPQSILQREPSAGLWEGQTDESEMGTTYDYIDAHLRGEAIPEKDREIIERMHRRTEHKRHTAATPNPFDA